MASPSEALPLDIVISAKDQASKAIQTVQKATGGLTSGLKAAGKDMMKAGAVMTAGITGPLGLLFSQMVSVAGDFESSMNVLDLAASDVDLETLRQVALKTGADVELVGIDAMQSADAMTNFYKAGLTTADIFGGPGGLNAYLEEGAALGGALRASIDLAAASELDLAAASDAISIAMATYGIDASEATRITNNFVQAADASVSSVPDLVASMQTIGPVAAGFGWSLEEVNTSLAILSERGISGSEAGTALKSMMTNIMRPTDAVKEALNALNIQLYNTDGTMKGLPEIIDNLTRSLGENATKTIRVSGLTADQVALHEDLENKLQKTTKSLGEYESGIVGAGLTETARAKKLDELRKQQANLLGQLAPYRAALANAETRVVALTEAEKNQYIQTLAGTYGMIATRTFLTEGTQGWQDMEAAIGTAATAEQSAAKRTEGWQATMKAFKGTIQTFMIQAGTPLIQMLTKLLQEVIMPLAEKIASADPKLIKLGLTLAGVAAAAGPVVTIFGGIITALGLLLSPIGLVVAAVAGLIAIWVKAQGGIGPAINKIMDALTRIGGSFQLVKDLLAQGAEPVRAIIAGFMDLGIISFDTAMKLGQAFDQIKGYINGLAAVFREGGIAGLVEKLGTDISGVLLKLGTDISTVLSGAFDSLKKSIASIDWSGFLSSLAERVTPALNTAREAVAAFGETIWNTFATRFPEAATSVSAAWEQITGFFSTAWATISPIVSSIGDIVQSTFGDSLSSAFANVRVAGEEMRPLWESLKQLWESLKPVIAALAKLYGVVLAAEIGVLLAAVRGLVEGFTAAMPYIVKIVTGAVDVISGVLDLLRNVFVGLYALIVGDSAKVTEAWEGIKEAGARIWNGIKDIVVGAVEGLVVLVYNFFVGFVDGIVAYFTELYNKLVGHSLVWDIVNGIINAFTSIDLKTIGQDIVDGLWQGIKERWDSVKSRVSGIASSVAGIFQEQGRSPWPSMIAVGKDVVAGLGLGIAQGQPLVSQPIGDVLSLFDNMINWIIRFAQSMPSVESLYDIGEVFEDMAEGIKDLSIAFVNMSKAMEAMASGRVTGDKITEFLDVYIGFVREAHERMRDLYLTLPDIKGASKSGVYLGKLVDAVTRDLSAIKPGDPKAVAETLNQVIWIAAELTRKIDELVSGEGGLGPATLARVAEWSAYVSDIASLLHIELDVTPSEATDFAQTIDLYVSQLALAVAKLTNWLKATTAQMLLDYELAAEVGGHIQSLLQLLGSDLTASLPELEEGETYVDRLTIWIGYAREAGNQLYNWMQDIGEQARENLKLAVPVAQNVSALFALLGANLTMQLPELKKGETYGDRLAAWVGYAREAGSALYGWMQDISEQARENLALAVPVAQDVVALFGLLGQNLTMQLPALQKGETFADRLAAWIGYARQAGSELYDWMTDISEQARANLELAGPVAQNVQNLMTLLGTSLTMQLPELRKGETFTDRLRAWIEYARMAGSELYNWMQAISEQARANLKAAVPVAQDTKALLDLLGVNLTAQLPELRKGETYADRLKEWVQYLRLAGSAIYDWIKDISDTARANLKLMGPVAEDIATLLSVLSIELTTKFSKVESYQEWAQSLKAFIWYLKASVVYVANQLDAMDKSTKQAIRRAAKIAGDVQTIVGVLGIEMATKFVKVEGYQEWALSLKNFIWYLKGSVVYIANQLDAMDKTTKQAIRKAAKIAGDIATVLGVLTMSLKVEKPGTGFKGALTAHLDAMDKALEMILPRLQALKEKWTQKGLAAFAEVADSIQGVLGLLGIDFWRGGEGLGFADSAAVLADELGWLLDDIEYALGQIVPFLERMQKEYGTALETAKNVGNLIKGVFDAILGAAESGAKALEAGLNADALIQLLRDFEAVSKAAAALGSRGGPGAQYMPPKGNGMPRMEAGNQPQAMEITMSLEIYSPQLDEVLTLVDGHASAKDAAGREFSVRLRPLGSAMSV